MLYLPRLAREDLSLCFVLFVIDEGKRKAANCNRMNHLFTRIVKAVGGLRTAYKERRIAFLLLFEIILGLLVACIIISLTSIFL